MEHVEKATVIPSILKETNPILLLGAGASVTSGIPLASEIVTKAAKWQYARQNGKDVDDPRITRSDWFPFLENQTWFNKDTPLSNFFQDAVKTFLRPQSFRKEFWVKILNPDLPVSIGYLRLVELFQLKKINHVLTVNFDNCITKARNEINKPHHIDLIKTPEDYVNISANGKYPQIIYLHGSYENYTDKNLEEEVKTLNKDLVDKVIPLLKDYPLIVVGYRGYEESIILDLLVKNAKRANNYKNGIYWCIIKREGQLESITDNVKYLAREIGDNFQLVEIESFDSLFDKVIWAHLKEDKITIPPRILHKYFDEKSKYESSFDLRDAKVFEEDEMDYFLLSTRVHEYCERLNIAFPEKREKKWLLSEMQNLNLVNYESYDKVNITNAGLLLFHKSPQYHIPSAKTVIRFVGSPLWLQKIFSLNEEIIEGKIEKVVEGNLWFQLNGINEALSLVNKPFRLKKEKSEMVVPYHPIALKEVIVNSLVHRDYEENDPNIIEITENSITIKNPGGLIKEVFSYFENDGSDIYEELKRGIKGKKGYRNPAIADLFYGSGDMDKKGSGLADVVKLIEDNNGTVKFYPEKNNTKFVVKIWSRPEAVDILTNTATPVSPLSVISTKFYSNIIELSIKTSIFCAKSTMKSSSVASMFEEYPNVSFPAFDYTDSKFYTFSDLYNSKNPLRNVISLNTIEEIALDEFINLDNSDYRFIRLLNSTFVAYFKRLGLIVDKDRKKAYFPKDKDFERSITYQAKIKKATRVVTKPKYAQDKQRIKYWEHKAFSFSFKRFDEEWVLIIEPSYTFSLDGIKNLVAPRKIGPLITKRSSRDFNLQVLNDLIFWHFILTKGAQHSYPRLETSSIDSLNPSIYLSSSFLTTELNRFEYFDEDNITNESYIDDDLEFESEIDFLIEEDKNTKDDNDSL